MLTVESKFALEDSLSVCGCLSHLSGAVMVFTHVSPNDCWDSL